MTNVEALKSLYTAFNGSDASVLGAQTTVEVLNGIAALFDGVSTAFTNADAIANIAAVASTISKPTQTKSATPTTSEQEIEPDSGKLLSKVTVAAVTAAIDENIAPANIKSGVTILGVEGTYTGEG